MYTYIHIGKTGGSYISEQCHNVKNFNVVHMSKPQYDSSWQYIIWIRDPVARFISAFNHSVNLILTWKLASLSASMYRCVVCVARTDLPLPRTETFT